MTKEEIEMEAEKRFPELLNTEKSTPRNQRRNQRSFIEGAEWMQKHVNPIKTKQAWDDSGLDFDQFVNPMDEIDEEMYYYFLGVVPTQYNKGYLFQLGEAEREENDLWYYSTFTKYNNKYYFLGILPEFKQ